MVHSMSTLAGKTELGFILQNLDVNNLTNQQVKLIKESVLRYGLVVLPRQTITPKILEDFTKKIGDIVKLSPLTSAGEHEDSCENVVRVSNILKDGSIVPNRYTATNWHTDGDFWSSPKNHIWNILYGECIPEEGGDTIFADCERAYHELTNEEKESLRHKKIIVSSANLPNIKSPTHTETTSNTPQTNLVAEHEILATHPVSGKKHLYVSGPEQAIQISGCNKEESLKEMRRLHKHILKPQNIYIHEWKKGDLIIWDNLMSVHKGHGNYGNQPRLLYKTQVRVTSL